MGCYEKEISRIQKTLVKFLSDREAEKVVNRICIVVAEVDKEIASILSDPLIALLYEYDGRFFLSRRTRLYHRAFDGLHVLQSLSDDMLETYFVRRRHHEATEWLMDSLGTYIWEAKVRRLNWEDSGTLSCITEEALDEMIRQTLERTKRTEIQTSPLSAEEETFFESYEDGIHPPSPALRQR